MQKRLKSLKVDTELAINLFSDILKLLRKRNVTEIMLEKY